MGTVVQLKNQINDSYFQLKDSVEDKLVLTEEKIKSGNMAKIFGLALLFSAMLALALMQVTNHQMAVLSLVGGDAALALPSYEALMIDYGSAFRDYGHGAFHGVIFGVLVALPILEISLVPISISPVIVPPARASFLVSNSASASFTLVDDILAVADDVIVAAI